MICGVLLFLALAGRCQEPGRLGIFFYSSESNINNFKALKIRFDTYLQDKGQFFFQPFNDRTQFERFVHEQRQGVLLLSSWHYRVLDASYQPKLVGVVAGKSSQKRILAAKAELKNIQALDGATIASAGNEAFTRDILKQMLGADNPLLDRIRIIPVPKDIDALLAVGFGMAKAALTTENSLRKMAQINPKQHANLHALKKSDDIYLPIVVVPQNADETVTQLLKVLENMSADPNGKTYLKMLGLDGLKRLSDEEKKGLRK